MVFSNYPAIELPIPGKDPVVLDWHTFFVFDNEYTKEQVTRLKHISSHTVASISLITVLAASRLIEPDIIPGVCIFKWITGIPCMFCGLTHAFHAISMGEFQQAFNFHPLGFLAYGIVLFHLIISLLRTFGWKGARLLPRLSVSTMMLSSFIFYTIIWIFRLAYGAIY